MTLITSLLDLAYIVLGGSCSIVVVLVWSLLVEGRLVELFDCCGCCQSVLDSLLLALSLSNE
jgi:drug/metabolite transporter superfamily protein YnfA